MAPLSPRRSSRARTVNPQSQQSSVSSSTSSRLERNTRALHKTPSGKSTPSASLSSEPLEEFDDVSHSRRRKRGGEHEHIQREKDEQASKNDKIVDKSAKSIIPIMANGKNDGHEEEEDEAVRCICGSEDYPGRPPIEGPDGDIFAGIELTDEVTGFYVQCDICKVWQHGACVGIFSQESSPDEYFCDKCRKDLHKVVMASNGQKYSKFLPLHRPSRATSQATSVNKEGTRSPKMGASKPSRPNSASQAAKRRSTMNSRDAAYDDELLRRAIEASKEDVGPDTLDHASRRVKRVRSESEDIIANAKRQRTGSRSVSPVKEEAETNGADGPEKETSAHQNGAKKSKSSSSSSSKVQRERSDREERERLRQEAASKRKGRADRRRAEDSDHSEELPLAASKGGPVKSIEPPGAEENPATAPPPAAALAPGTPPASQGGTNTSHKKGARSHHKKTKGRNQYTKDRDVEKEVSPARSASRDVPKGVEETLASAPAALAAAAAAANTAKSTGAELRPGGISKNKQMLANKMSMQDMRRRVAAIMEFISRVQVDLAAENGSCVDEEGSPPTDVGSAAAATAAAAGKKRASDGSVASAGSAVEERPFKGLSCIEMMDVLTRDLVKWQKHFGS